MKKLFIVLLVFAPILVVAQKKDVVSGQTSVDFKKNAPDKLEKRSSIESYQAAEEYCVQAENFYYGRNGSQKSFKKAFELFEKAAELELPRAICWLGYMYNNGHGVEQNLSKAVKMYQLSADYGYAKAQTNLGLCYLTGEGVPMAYDKAASWFMKAADQGNTQSQVLLAGMYRQGRGVYQNYKKALELYEKAANKGDVSGIIGIGLMYEYGNGVQQSFKKAEEYYKKAKEKNPSSGADLYLSELQKKISQKTKPVEIVDSIDISIPITNKNNTNLFVIIIANEDYQKESKVDFAINDGKIFKDYCKKTLGIPDKNIKLCLNATKNNIIEELDWIQQLCEAYQGEASVIFYYAGHGLPDEASGSPYLLPVDGSSRILQTCFSIAELYNQLGKLNAKKVTVFLDACFSGAVRDGGMLISARGVAIKSKEMLPSGNMIVLTAAQGNETAYKYEKTKHGLFTYYLLKKLQESKGNITMGDLCSFVKQQVKRKSIVENGKSQTPSILVSNKLREKWESIRFD